MNSLEWLAEIWAGSRRNLWLWKLINKHYPVWGTHIKKNFEKDNKIFKIAYDQNNLCLTSSWSEVVLRQFEAVKLLLCQWDLCIRFGRHSRWSDNLRVCPSFRFLASCLTGGGWMAGVLSGLSWACISLPRFREYVAACRSPYGCLICQVSCYMWGDSLTCCKQCQSLTQRPCRPVEHY